VLGEMCDSSARIVRVPRTVVFGMGHMSELMLGLLGKKSPLSRYRLRSALALRRFASLRAESLLGWKPKVGVRDGIRRVRESTPPQS